jgi:hypothetical protein
MGVIYSLKEQMAKMEVNCTECARMSEPCTTQTTDQVIEALRLQMAKMQSTDPLHETSTTEPAVRS